jgi:hypothetical protein
MIARQVRIVALRGCLFAAALGFVHSIATAQTPTPAAAPEARDPEQCAHRDGDGDRSGAHRARREPRAPRRQRHRRFGPNKRSHRQVHRNAQGGCSGDYALRCLLEPEQPQFQAWEDARDTAPVVGLTPVSIEIRGPGDLDAALAKLAAEKPDAAFINWR